MKKKICIVLCLGCIGTVSVVGCSNKNFDSKVTGDIRQLPRMYLIY